MNKTLLINFILCFTLTACGGGGGGGSPADNGSGDGDGKSDISDTTPNGFGFTDLVDQELSVEIISNEVTITGMNDNTPISIEHAQYSINGAEPSSQTSTVNSGDKVVITLITPSDYESNISPKLTVGTLTVGFTVSTRIKDISPDAFSFTSQGNSDLATLSTSNTVTLSGIDNGTSISIENGSYSLNGGAFTNQSSPQIKSGDTLTIQVLSSSEFETKTQVAVTVGTEISSFSVTTREKDITPGDFEFTQVVDSEPSASKISNTITLAGIDDETDISIIEGLYSINGGEFISEVGKVKKGDTLAIKTTSASEFSTLAKASVTVGDFSTNFQVSTRPKDITPTYNSPSAATDIDLNTHVESNAITFSEFDGDNISITGAEYKLNDGEWTSAGTVSLSENDAIVLRVLSSSSYSTKVSSSVSGNGWLFDFGVTTLEDTAPTVSFNKIFEDDGSTPLNGSEELVLIFSETMQTETLNLIGDMVPDCNDLSDATSCLNLVWSENDTVLTLSPKEDFYWYADVRSLQVAITGDGTLGLEETISATVLPVFETFQAADVVIGQNDFESRSSSGGGNDFRTPRGVDVFQVDGQSALLITDISNSGVVKYNAIPTENGADRDERFGENGNGDSSVYKPHSVVALNERIYIADTNNDRAIWVATENFDVDGGLADSGKATSLVGQEDFGTSISDQCSQNSLYFAADNEVVETENGVQWLVADFYNRRVMIWSNPDDNKGSDASIVLGQIGFNNCSYNAPSVKGLNSLPGPTGVWSNGEKLIVTDDVNHRLVVWNTFPTENNQSPDFQVGQESDTGSGQNAGQSSVNQRGFSFPVDIGGNKHQVCVVERNNNRVLVWSELPESSDDLADIVIGQSDFTKNAENDANQDGTGWDDPIDGRVLYEPRACDMSLEQLFIVDARNFRVLVYNALNKRPVAE